MSDPRPAKRARTTRVSGHRDAIPLEDDAYDFIRARDGRLQKSRNSIRTAPPRRVTERISSAWSNATTWEPPDSRDFALDPNDGLYNEALAANVMEEAEVPKAEKKKRSNLSRRPHAVWKELHRQSYLDEILRWAGRGDFQSAVQCPDCLSRSTDAPGPPEYRCEECALPDLTCSQCCVRRHRLHPFHRIQRWTGQKFIRATLKELGLKYQLNHGILHVNGIHEVDIQYCGCHKAIASHRQLLRRGLYPSSQRVIKTCATFELLDLLHKLALTTKASTYDFYRALEYLTTNTGMNVPRSRYKALFRIVLQWRHLKMLKWAGRANDPSGVEGTQPGELAVKCPSCPHPGINLPEDWESAPPGMRFLYMAIICMDANFRLKNQIVSNYSQDPGLGIGWAYMLPRQPYEKYVLSRAHDDDISTCVGFQALAQANTKFSVGLRHTGVGAAVCGRSEMILPCGVGNLQKGERYANMDFIFGSAAQFVAALLILISYDICCQWFTNLFSRMEEHWPDGIKLNPRATLIPAIPKLHEPMHEAAGHQVYSLNFIKGCGLSDCECPERVWSSHNALSNSTKTQGPGSRHDVLDDHFGFWNWRKYVGLGKTLLRRYKAAVAQRNIQQEGHRGLTASLDDVVVKKWETVCEEWEGDPFPKSKLNPYHSEDAYLSEVQVKKELADEEEERLAKGGVSLHKTSASGFIQLGLDLEDTQRRVRRLAKYIAAKGCAAVGGERTLLDERSNLRLRLRVWDKLVPIYMPGVLQYESDLSNDGNSDHPSLTSSQSNLPEDAYIWLPSALPSEVREQLCRQGLAKIEERLRDAQCADSLRKIRRVLRVKSRMIHFKNKNVRGQRDGTRSRAVIDRIHLKARNAADRYRAARAAKLALAGPGAWEATYRELQDSDIRGYQDPDRLRPKTGRPGVLEDGQHQNHLSTPNEEQEFELFNEVRSRRDGTGETRRTLSWIWTTNSAGVSEDDQDDVLRLEWAKSRARADRAVEEVLLLKEEMRRVLTFLRWKSAWWLERALKGAIIQSDMAEAAQAFALSQSALQNDLADHFCRLWKAPLEDDDKPTPNPNIRTEGAKSNAAGGAQLDRGREAEIGADDDDEDEEEDDGGGGGDEEKGERAYFDDDDDFEEIG